MSACLGGALSVSGYAVSQPFHLAFPVHDLHAARAFYGGLLGCPEARKEGRAPAAAPQLLLRLPTPHPPLPRRRPR